MFSRLTKTGSCPWKDSSLQMYDSQNVSEFHFQFTLHAKIRHLRSGTLVLLLHRLCLSTCLLLVSTELYILSCATSSRFRSRGPNPPLHIFYIMKSTSAILSCLTVLWTSLTNFRSSFGQSIHLLVRTSSLV